MMPALSTSHLPLTRAVALDDYLDCYSPAAWQQRLARDVYYAKWSDAHPPTARVLCYNWGAAPFRVPGSVEAIYRTYADRTYADPLVDEDEDEPCALIFALSVLDRIETPRRFLKAQGARLIPGGLIVCTFAVWNAAGPDCAFGHELRQRIYDGHRWRRLTEDAKDLGLHPFGGVDFRYKGDTLGDHTLGSFVAEKGVPR